MCFAFRIYNQYFLKWKKGKLSVVTDVCFVRPKARQGPIYQKPGPPTPNNERGRKHSGKDGRKPGTRNTPRRTPRRSPRLRSTPGRSPVESLTQVQSSCSFSLVLCAHLDAALLSAFVAKPQTGKGALFASLPHMQDGALLVFLPHMPCLGFGNASVTLQAHFLVFNVFARMLDPFRFE